MQIIDTTEATSLITSVTGGITDNMPAIMSILGFAVAVSVAFGLLRFGLAKLTGAWKS